MFLCVLGFFNVRLGKMEIVTVWKAEFLTISTGKTTELLQRDM